MTHRADRTRRAIATAAAVGLTAGMGVAVAQWSTRGTGDGAAGARAPVSVVVSGGTAAADLFPGATGGDLAVVLDNPNPYPVRFTALTAGAVSSDTEACPAGAVAVTGGAIDLVVPAAVDDHPATLPDVVTMARWAPDGCQGATFAVEVRLEGDQAA